MGNNSSHSSSSSRDHHHHHSSSSSSTAAGRNRTSSTGAAAAAATSAGAEHQPPPSTASVDGGFLEPQSHIYASSLQDYNKAVVHKLIQERRLAPFFLGLNDHEDDWDLTQIISALEDADAQAQANLREALVAAKEAATEAEVAQLSNAPQTRKGKEAAAAAQQAVTHRERLLEMIKFREKKGGGLQWSGKAQVARLYLEGAVECPICFLYYPQSLVNTRCCDQPICTECFVQIKRADADATHLESEPAACPFCMEPNFGCVYHREKPARPEMQSVGSAGSGGSSSIEDPGSLANGTAAAAAAVTPKPRRKSFAHTEKHVVTTDQIHPDWEAKLEAVKATVARRANRRIVFRNVGGRLIPVGVTSGRESDGANATMSTTELPPGFAAQVAAALDPSSGGSGSGGRRATRRRNQEMAQYLESMGVNVGQDLEEMMVMEAMRLSLQEDEERRKKEEEAKAKAAAAGGSDAATAQAETSAQGASRAALLSEAIGAPIGTRPSPPATLSSVPVLAPSVVRPSSSSTPTYSSNASPLASSSPSPARDRNGTSSPSTLGALAAGGLEAVAGSPSSSHSFSRTDSERTALGTGVVGAGLTAQAPLRVSTSSTSSPSTSVSEPTTSSSAAQIPELPAFSPLTVTPTTASVATATTDSSDWDAEVPLTPSQGYQQLEDDDEEEPIAANGSVFSQPASGSNKATANEERLEGQQSSAKLSSHSLVDAA